MGAPSAESINKCALHCRNNGCRNSVCRNSALYPIFAIIPHWNL